VRSSLVFLAFALAVVACRSTSSAREARLEAVDGGIVVSHAGRAAPVPFEDLGHGGARAPVSVERGGKRLAYPLPGGGSRIVYAVGDGLYLGPSGPTVRGGGQSDFSAAPPLDEALGAIFERAGARRAQAVVDVKKELGEAGVARMLGDASHLDDPAWDEAFGKLPEGARADVTKAVAATLEPGKPVRGLARAVRLADLFDPSRAPAFAARIRELAAPGREIREPRAAAVLLRALAKIDRAEGASVGCELVLRKPEDPVLLEAATLAVARGGGDCEAVASALGDDACSPWFRCAGGKPLDGRESTQQDEPLCTTAELASAIEAELERTPDDVLAGEKGTRPGLFAYAALAGKSREPASFLTAHARRRYALTQPKAPPCDPGLAPGTPCHCEESVVRDWACRHAESSSASVGVCRFEIDDEKKRLFNVVATPPP
jgi:hypothetical protein